MIASGPTARHAVILASQNIGRDVKSTGRSLLMAGLFLVSLFLTSLSMAGLTAPAFAAKPITPLTGRITIEYRKDKTAETPADTSCPDGTVKFGINCVPAAGGPKTSSSPPPTTPPRVGIKAPEGEEPSESALFPREVQVQLDRVGCLNGGIDGDWGSGSRAALGKFYALAHVRTNDREPTAAALRAVRAKGEGFCLADNTSPRMPPDHGDGEEQKKNLRCDRGFAKVEGRCVKICRRGFEDNGRGVCIRTVRPENDAPRMPPDHGDGEEQKKNTVRCPANAHHTTGTNCKCNDGFDPRGQTCVPRQKPKPQAVRCPANAHHTTGTNCKCNDGFDPRGQTCVPRQKPQPQAVRCPANAHHTTGTNCACNNGYSPQGQQCVRQQQKQAPAPGPENCGPPMRWYNGRCVPG